ncbi:MAG: enoyl-CoA hydratase-related protein, partial [Dehalococcoidales bacterium]
DDAKFGMPAARAQGTQPTHMWTYLAGPQWAKYILYTGNSVDGKTAERIGLVLKSVPRDELDDEVNHLAATVAKVPYGLLTVHKRIVNMTLEMMGRGLVQRLAAEGDAMGHLDPVALEFDRIAATRGLKEALDWRDASFGDYRASPGGKQAD